MVSAKKGCFIIRQSLVFHLSVSQKRSSYDTEDSPWQIFGMDILNCKDTQIWARLNKRDTLIISSSTGKFTHCLATPLFKTNDNLVCKQILNSLPPPDVYLWCFKSASSVLFNRGGRTRWQAGRTSGYTDHQLTAIGSVFMFVLAGGGGDKQSRGVNYP